MSDKTSYKTDMHLHTYYSDGLLSPAQVVKRAKKLGCDMIAITDHDGTDGVKEAQLAAAEIKGIKVVSGLEFSTQDIYNEKKLTLHVLGYYIDIENETLQEEIVLMRKRREVRNEKLLAFLQSTGFDVRKEDLKLHKYSEYVGKPDIARALFEKGYIDTPKAAFAPGKFLESSEAKAIKKETLATERAIELISHAGGLAVLAHPMKIKNIGEKNTSEFFDNLDVLIRRLKSYGLKGIECFHTDHTESEALKLVELAEKYRLHITEGSDYHGDDL